MVSSVFVDAISHPHDAINDIYDTDNREEFPKKVAAHFSQIFRDPHSFNEIPILSVNNGPQAHREGTLVRFSAMVQDTTCSPEIYISHYNSGKCGGWGLESDLDDQIYQDFQSSNLGECAVIWAVSIPGQSEWETPEVTKPQELSLYPHKYPLPDSSHVGVQLKIYDTSAAKSFKSTEIYTFVGILTSEPMHTTLDTPTPTSVPTLHVVYSSPLPSTLIPRSYPLIVSRNAEELWYELVEWVAEEALAGDTATAQWILLALITRVQSRTPPILPLTLTISRFPTPPDGQSLPGLISVLALITPLLVPVPLSLSFLNAVPFSPSSPQSSETSDLYSGLLQLPKGTSLLFTESGVSEGLLQQKGIDNVRAVQEIITSQLLDYVFPFTNFSFETDLGVVILSEGRKSTFFQTSTNVPLSTSSCDLTNQDLVSRKFYKPESEITRPPREKLEAFRALLGSAKVGTVTVEEKTAEYIQDDFVAQRKKEQEPGKSPMSSDDLIVQMMVAKLLALALQKTEVTKDIWDKTKELENTRHTRLAEAYQSIPQE